MTYRDVIEIAGALALAAGAVVAYHSYDLTTLHSSVQNIEADSTVARISRLVQIKCRDGSLDAELEHILEKQRRRYHAITGREFSLPECAR